MASLKDINRSRLRSYCIFKSISELTEMYERHKWKTLKRKLLDLIRQKILAKRADPFQRRKFISSIERFQTPSSNLHFQAIPFPKRSIPYSYLGQLNRLFFGDPEQNFADSAQRLIERIAFALIRSLEYAIYIGLFACVYKRNRVCLLKVSKVNKNDHISLFLFSPNLHTKSSR